MDKTTIEMEIFNFYPAGIDVGSYKKNPNRVIRAKISRMNVSISQLQEDPGFC